MTFQYMARGYYFTPKLANLNFIYISAQHSGYHCDISQISN